MSDLIRLYDLTQTYNLSNSDLLHISKNGKDYKLDFDWLMRNVETNIGKNDSKWNASHIRGVDVQLTNIAPRDVMIFENNGNANAFINRRLLYTDIDYSLLQTPNANRYLKVNGDSLISEEIKITEVIPSNANQRGKYLRVSDDGLNIIESDLNLSQFMVSPGSVISSMDTVASGISTIGDITINKPKPEMGGYVISARSSNITTATAQIIIDYGTYETYIRTHDGVSNNQGDFGAWYYIFNNKTHPLSDLMNLDSSKNIATSAAVNSLREYTVDLVETTRAQLDTNLRSLINNTKNGLQQQIDTTNSTLSSLSNRSDGEIARLDARIDTTRVQLDTARAQLDTSLRSLITNTGNGLQQQIDAVNTSLSNLSNSSGGEIVRLDGRIDTVAAGLATHRSSGDHDGRYMRNSSDGSANTYYEHNGRLYMRVNGAYRQIYPSTWG